MESKLKIKNLNLNDDSDSDLELENLEESNVDVGLIDEEVEDLTEEELKLYRIQMRSPFFPSKVGGKPAWLDYSNLPLAVGAGLVNTDDNNNKKANIYLQCDGCKSQLVFLLQIYAPISSNDKYLSQVENLDDCFHRVLYVFLCSNTECKSRTFEVLRSQLNRENDFYSYEAPPTNEDGESEIELCKNHLKTFYKNLSNKNLLNQCSVCGVSSSKKCSKCNFSFFCSQNHQLFDWTKLNHKTLCAKYSNKNLDELIDNWIEDENSSLKYTNEKSSTIFPEREILIEPEDLDLAKLKKEKEFKYDEKKIAQDLESNEGNDQDFDALKENDYDKDFERFKKISAQEYSQVIRYERGGSPLWCTKYGKLKENDLPHCEYCGSKRIFEFQVTPQLLCYLNIEETNQANSLDWAGLFIYTCVKNCKAANNSYAFEYIYKQDFVK